MTTRFVSTTRIGAAVLNDKTPLGLFQPIGTDLADLLLIVDREDGRYAIVLLGAEAARFQAWPLRADMDSWGGISFGAVEVLVDPETASFSEVAGRPSPGNITVARGRVLLGAKAERGGMRVEVDIGPSLGVEGDAGATFSRWQLVQRNRLDEPTVLFDSLAK